MTSTKTLSSEEKKIEAVQYLDTGVWFTFGPRNKISAVVALIALFHHLRHLGKQVRIYPFAMNMLTDQMNMIIENGAIDEESLDWENLLVRGIAWKKDVRATCRCNLALLNLFCHLGEAARVSNHVEISAKWALYLMNYMADEDSLFDYDSREDGFWLVANELGRQALGQSASYFYPCGIDSDHGRQAFANVFAHLQGQQWELYQARKESTAIRNQKR